MGWFDAFKKERVAEDWKPVVTKEMLVAEMVRRGFVEDDRQDIPQSQITGFRVEVGEHGTLFLQIPFDAPEPDALSAAVRWLESIGRDSMSYGVVHPGPELAIDRKWD
ncbi:MAG: hypothetical protein Q7U75_00760 [Desulfobacterales bacterium]|nr:hypothetical protein [Desulfobacterales bacterium]